LKQILAGISAILDSREKIKLGKLIIFDLVIGILDITFLGLTLYIINFYTKNVSQPGTSFLPPALSNPNSLLLIAVFLLLFALKNWFGFMGLRSQHHFFYSVASRLSKRNISDYLLGHYIRFVHVDSSVQIRNISQEPIEFSHYVLTNFQQVISQSVLILFSIGAILFYRPTLFVLLFLLMLPPVVGLTYLIRNKMKAIRLHTKIAGEKTIQNLQESLSAYVESNVYGKNDFFINRYFKYQQQLNENIASQQTLYSLPSRLIEVCAIFGFFILIMINKWSTSTPAVDLLTIGVFMAACYKIIPGIVKILNSTGQMKTYEFTLSDLLPAVEKPVLTNNVIPVNSIQSVRFKQVRFKFKQHEILNGLDLELNSGDFAGLSGSSGIGKSTLINLMLGFLEPDCGQISINNTPLDDAGRQRYWHRVSYVKQQPFFIHDTILKNITLSDDGYDSVKLEEVLSFCGIDAFLDRHPGGLEKIISENGKNISGGQRQRIALARALYHDFDLLILDEPFSEMDREAENDILEKLQVLAQGGRMILLITHNASSLSFCNKIIAVDGN
jgi:ABC-type multidrug transport system fused ATPase/permease subunit